MAASGLTIGTVKPALAEFEIQESTVEKGEKEFEYGWRAEYDFAKHWGIGVEMFGGIDDLAYAGSFNDQNHSIGPTLFWNPGSEEEEAKGVARTTIRSQALPTWSFPSTSASSSARPTSPPMAL